GLGALCLRSSLAIRLSLSFKPQYRAGLPHRATVEPAQSPVLSRNSLAELEVAFDSRRSRFPPRVTAWLGPNDRVQLARPMVAQDDGSPLQTTVSGSSVLAMPPVVAASTTCSSRPAGGD